MTGTEAQTGTTAVRGYDVRYFIALALGLIGVFLVVVALVVPAHTELQRTGGLHANLWTGVVMVVVSVALALWARLRPMVIERHGDDATLTTDAPTHPQD